MKKAYFLVVLFLCGLSVGNLFASASAAAAAALGQELRVAAQELINAAREGKEEKVEELLKVEGINVNAVNQYGMTPLIMAAVHGHTAIVKLLLQVDGINVNAQHGPGWTALRSAVIPNHTTIVDLLLEKEGIDVNIADFYGRTVLMDAAFQGHADIVQKLLDAGADKNIQRNGQTAESLARAYGHEDLADIIRDYRSGRRIKAARKTE